MTGYSYSYHSIKLIHCSARQRDVIKWCFEFIFFSSFIYFRISRVKYNDIDLNKKNTHKSRFYDLISSINSIKEERKSNIKRPPVKCNHIYLGYIRDG